MVSTVTNKITFASIFGAEDSSQAAPVTVSSHHGGNFHVIKNSGPRDMLSVCYLQIKFRELHGFHVSKYRGRAHMVYCSGDSGQRDLRSSAMLPNHCRYWIVSISLERERSVPVRDVGSPFGASGVGAECYCT